MNDYNIYEEIIIPIKIADYIINNISSHVFLKWKELGCLIEPRAENKAIWIIMNGTEDENDNRFEKIFKILKFAEEASKKENGQNLRFRIITRMLIPNQKCGYIVGRNGATLKKIVKDFGVVALMDSGQTDSIPEGFGRLILKGVKLEGISSARLQIKYLIQIALDLNPFGPADGKKRIMALGKSVKAEERIKVPLFSAFSEEQKKQFREIQRTSRVDFIVDKENKPPDGRFLLLKGELCYVIETKKRISKLIFDLRYSPVEETTQPPLPPLLPPSTKTPPKTTTFLSSLDEAATLPSIDVVIPYPNFLGVLGSKGDRIKSLRTELDVNLTFLGDNKAQYIEGRTLRISGKNERKIYLAKLFIQKEFIEKWTSSPPTNNNRNNILNINSNIIPINNNNNIIDRRRRVDNNGNDWGKIEEDSKMEVLVPQEIAKIMIKIKIKFCLTSYQLRRPRCDGFQIVVLKGSKESLEQANKELDLLTSEYLKNKEKNKKINWREEEEIEEIKGRNEGKNEEEEENKRNKKKSFSEEKMYGEFEGKKEEGNEVFEEKKEEKDEEEEKKFKEEENEVKLNNEDVDEDEEFEWRSVVNINEEEEEEEIISDNNEEIIEEEEEDDDQTICGDFDINNNINECLSPLTSDAEKAIQDLLLNTSFTSEEEEEEKDLKEEEEIKEKEEEIKEKNNFEEEEEKNNKKKEEEEENNNNNLIGNNSTKERKKDLLYKLMLDGFLGEIIKNEEAKDREIALLRRKVQQFKFKVFQLETALSVAIYQKTSKNKKKRNKRGTRK